MVQEPNTSALLQSMYGASLVEDITAQDLSVAFPACFFFVFVFVFYDLFFLRACVFLRQAATKQLSMSATPDKRQPPLAWRALP